MIDRPALQARGYIVIHMTERSWRIRGIERFITVWPEVKKYRWGAYSKQSEAYEDLETLLARIQPFPVKSEQELFLFELWQDGLAKMYDRLACTIPYPHLQ